MKKKQKLDASDFIESISESTRTVRRASLSLLAVGAYLLATTSEVTDIELLAANEDILLPLVSVPVSIKRFYWIAPWIFICLQIKFTIQLLAHEDRILRIRKRYKKKEWQSNVDKILPISLFNLSKEDQLDSRSLRLFLKVIYFLVHAAFPPVVLLVFQTSFLPYHSDFITWNHQFISILSILVSMKIYFRYPILTIKDAIARSRISWISILKLTRNVLVVSLPIYIAIILDFPKTQTENEENLLFTSLKLNDIVDRNISIEHQNIMEKIFTPAQFQSVRTENFRSNIEVFKNIGSLDDPNVSKGSIQEASVLALDQAESVRDLSEKGIIVESGRDLKFAKFSNVIMRSSIISGVDLSGATFTNVDLENTDLKFSDLSKTTLFESNFNKTMANGVDFSESVIEKSTFVESKMAWSEWNKSLVALSNFDKAFLFGLTAEESNWAANSFKNSTVGSSKLTNSTFINNEFENTSFEKADFSESRMLSSEYFSQRYLDIFGHEYIPLKKTSDETRRGLNKHYYYDIHKLEKSFYEEPAAKFEELMKTLRFLISVKTESPSPKISREQVDQLVVSVSEQTSYQQESIKSFSLKIQRICSGASLQDKKDLAKQIVEELPVTLTEIKNIRRISDPQTMSVIAFDVIELFRGILEDNCGLEEFNQLIPKKIPYLKSFNGFFIVTDYVDVAGIKR